MWSTPERIEGIVLTNWHYINPLPLPFFVGRQSPFVAGDSFSMLWGQLYRCDVSWASGAGAGGSNNAEQPRTVFHRALEAVALMWADAHLQAILRGDVGSSYICHSCHGARGMYCHVDSAVSYMCIKHDVAGRLIWTGMLHALLSTMQEDPHHYVTC